MALSKIAAGVQLRACSVLSMTPAGTQRAVNVLVATSRAATDDGAASVRIGSGERERLIAGISPRCPYRQCCWRSHRWCSAPAWRCR